MQFYLVLPSRVAYDEFVTDLEADLPDTYAFQAGRLFGTSVTVVQGFAEITAAPHLAGGGIVLSCVLTGPETLGAGCVAGAGGSILVGEAVLVHGLSVEGVSRWNAKAQVLSLIQAKGKGGGGGANWRPTDTGEYVRVRKLTDAEVKARGWEPYKEQYTYGAMDGFYFVTEGPLKGKIYLGGEVGS